MPSDESRIQAKEMTAKNSNSKIFQHHNKKKEHNPVRFEQYSVNVSHTDDNFIVSGQCARDNLQSPEIQSSSITVNCIIDTGVPNFAFLGHLDVKLRRLTDKTLSNYITKCAQDSFYNDHYYRIGRMTEEEKTITTLQSMFYSALRPDISNAHYIQQLVKYLCLPSYVYVLAFVYLKRMGEKKTNNGLHLMRLDQDNMHRLVITACYISAKILTPKLKHATASQFSNAGGTKSAHEVRMLVSAFCELIGYDFHVTKAEFIHMLERL